MLGDHGAGSHRCLRPPRPPVPRLRGPGARHPGVRPGPGPLSCLWRPGQFRASSHRAWAMPLRSRGVSRRAHAAGGAAISESIRTYGRQTCPTGSHGSARSVVWRDAARRLGSTRARRSTWPGSRTTRGARRTGLYQLGVVHAHADPPDVAQAEAHYQQALALAEALGRPPLQAHCHHGLGMLYARDRPAGAGPCCSVHRDQSLPCHGHDLLATPGGGGADRGGGALITRVDRSIGARLPCRPPVA